MKAPLEKIASFLEEKGYPIERVTATEVAPEQIVTLLMKDPEGEDIALQISLTEEGDLNFLQFFILCHLQIAESAISETSRLILNINANFDMATFGIIESAHLLYYRYLHIFEVKKFSQEAFMAVIASIELLFNTLLPAIYPIAQGKKGLEELQKETQQALIDHEFQML